MVDEDPGSARHPYEKNLTSKNQNHGVIKFRDDASSNTILMLKVKLEDWIIEACKKSNINITEFGLHSKPNDLHDVIYYRLLAYEKLLSTLKEAKNPSINQLNEWLKEASS